MCSYIPVRGEIMRNYLEQLLKISNFLRKELDYIKYILDYINALFFLVKVSEEIGKIAYLSQ